MKLRKKKERLKFSQYLIKFKIITKKKFKGTQNKKNIRKIFICTYYTLKNIQLLQEKYL